MDRAAAWFHLLLSLSLGTIIYIMMFGAHWPGSFEPIETYGTVAARSSKLRRAKLREQCARTGQRCRGATGTASPRSLLLYEEHRGRRYAGHHQG